ncbi:MAG TPA: efflux transporter outer membrane subunit [Candidatus Deferrimicrobiaceae bacterium]
MRTTSREENALRPIPDSRDSHQTYCKSQGRASVMRLCILLIPVLLAGCAAGPDYRRPANPAVSSYAAAALPAETAEAKAAGGASQRFLSGGEIPARWWEMFRSEALDGLIRQALDNSPTLAAARARVREAEENRRAQAGELLPRVDGSVSASRQKISGVGLTSGSNDIAPFTLYNASVSVSYALDLFGGKRRALEALQAQVDFRAFQLEGAWLTLAANVVTTAVQEGALRAQIGATREILATEEQQLSLVEQQFRLGAVARPDVLAQQAQIAQTRATLPPLERQLAQSRHRLAVLVGRFPAEAQSLPEFDLEGLSLPRELPVSLPSSLARRRPDVRAAEEVLHAASATVGVATADLYPQVTLSGSLGSEATRAGDLFGGGTSVWSLAAGALQPLFRGGELSARRRAAVAAYDEATAQYRETVLLAFQNVADVLRALEMDAQALAAQADAEASARAALDLSRKQFELGGGSYLTLLNAERQHQQSRIGLVQAQAARFADTAALFQALGGGWWNPETEGGGAKVSKNDRKTPKGAVRP